MEHSREPLKFHGFFLDSILRDHSKGDIVNVLWDLKKRGYSDFTIRNTLKALSYLDKHCNLNDPESIKGFIASLESPSYKKNLCRMYGYYASFKGIQFDSPRYEPIDKLPKIPREEHINYIILHASRKYASAFSIIRDTGIRPLECSRIKLRDIDFNSKTLTVSTAKGGKGRIVKLKDDTIARIKDYVGRHLIGLDDFLYLRNPELLGHMWRLARNRAVNKTKILELKTIRLYDLRHFHATMLYHKTKDILFVKQELGHRRVDSTLRYTQLINFESDEFHVKVASTLEECTKLLESGFEYVTDFESKKLFRKRK